MLEPLPSGNEAWRYGCIGPFYGDENDAYPCDVPECPACKPRRELASQKGGE